MSIFKNNKALAISLLKKANSGENLLSVLDMIVEDIKQDDKQDEKHSA